MGLIKEFEHASGVMGNYWRIATANIDRRSQTASLQLEGFVSLEAAQLGKAPLTSKALQFGAGELDFEGICEGTTPIGKFYDCLKTKAAAVAGKESSNQNEREFEYFSDAVDA